MKDAIHPAYHQAKVHCQGCGREFTVGSTAESITVELCSACHPFYTGKQKLVDTAGRVDRFRARQASAAKAKDAAAPAEKPTSDKADDQPNSDSQLAEMKEQLEASGRADEPAADAAPAEAETDPDDTPTDDK